MGSNDKTRTADILLPLWALSPSGAIDVTVSYPLNDEFVNGASDAEHMCLNAVESIVTSNNSKSKKKAINPFANP